MPVWESLTPDIYAHDKGAIDEGYPQFLTKGPPGLSDLNRTISDDGNFNPDPSYLQRDEYPFAFTEEGGLGASNAFVPGWEQIIQSIQLRALSRVLNPKDKFIIVPISKKDAPDLYKSHTMF